MNQKTLHLVLLYLAAITHILSAYLLPVRSLVGSYNMSMFQEPCSLDLSVSGCVRVLKPMTSDDAGRCPHTVAHCNLGHFKVIGSPSSTPTPEVVELGKMPLRGLVKNEIPGPYPWVSDSVGLGGTQDSAALHTHVGSGEHILGNWSSYSLWTLILGLRKELSQIKRKGQLCHDSPGVLYLWLMDYSNTEQGLAVCWVWS